MNKTILVTGGTGFIGSGIVKSLIKQGHKVRVLDNQSRGKLRRLEGFKDDFEFIKGDIRDQRIVLKASEKVDSIIHLAYVNGTEFFYSIPDVVLDIGVKGIINVLDASIKNQVPELFLASSSEVYAEPKIIPTPENIPLVIPDVFNPRFSYSGGKIISELMVLNFGRKFFKRVVIFRPHNVYGPDMGWEHIIPQFVLRIKEITKKTSKKILDFPIQGSGNETRAFIFIDDFILGFTKLLEKGRHLNIYNIGIQKETSIRSVASEVAKYFKREIKIIQSRLSEGSVFRRCPDVTKLKKLGFLPKVEFTDGVRLTTEWYTLNSNQKDSSN